MGWGLPIGRKAACTGGLGSGILIMNQDFAALALQADFGAAAAGACAVAFYGNRQAVGRTADGGHFSIACACIVADIALPALGAVLAREFVG